MRISDWSSDVCSSDLGAVNPFQTIDRKDVGLTLSVTPQISEGDTVKLKLNLEISGIASGTAGSSNLITNKRTLSNVVSIENGQILVIGGLIDDQIQTQRTARSEEHTSELQSLMRISYAVFCLKKKKKKQYNIKKII